MRDNPDDLANQKIKRAIKELKRICNNYYIDDYTGPTTIIALKKLIKDLKKQD